MSFSIENGSRPSTAEVLERGMVPILPVEYHLLEVRFGNLVDRQLELGKDLRDAMTQTSETWHDNAPADAINLEALRMSSSAEHISDKIRNSVIVDYPVSDEQVALGSLMTISLNGRPEKKLFLVGAYAEMGDLLLPDVSASTIGSPVGAALLGTPPEEEIEYNVGKRKLTAVVRKIELPAAAFQDPAVL